MDIMEYLRQYGGEVKNRVMNPGQTLATALKEGMPTEQNPLGMFGVGSVGKVGKGVEESFLTNMSKDKQKIILPDKTAIFKTKEGTWVNDQGKLIFEDSQHMMDSLRDLQMFQKQQNMSMLPDVMSSNRPSSPFYKDPFKDTTR